jgi:signal peptidase II
VRVGVIKDGYMNAEHGAARRVPAGRYLLFFAVAIGGCAVDLATKSWIFAKLGMPDPDTPPIWIWRNVFSLTTSLNDGALFGIGKGFVAGFAVLSIIAAFFVLYWLFYAGAARDGILTFTLALIAAGIFGNLFDRLGLHGLVDGGQRVYAVRDWLHFQIRGVINWPVFNLADSMLVCGAVLLFLHVCLLQRSSDGDAKSEASERSGSERSAASSLE